MLIVSTPRIRHFLLGPAAHQRGTGSPREQLIGDLTNCSAAISSVLVSSAESLRLNEKVRNAGRQRENLTRAAERQLTATMSLGPVPGMEGKSIPAPVNSSSAGFLEVYHPQIKSHWEQIVVSKCELLERLIFFWVNHFAVSIRKGSVVLYLSLGFEREAIRAHVLGRFEDMLVAATMHPAMLAYLDNTGSVGPNSQAGRRRGRSLNENLAREVLELHTLGVQGGYTQADVTRFAEVLTGWTMAGANQPNHGEFVFNAGAHEPGAKTILGKTYPEAGLEQGRAVLRDLAVHPSTARHIAWKLARHFVADEPPPTLVAKLERSFNETRGDLKELARTLIEAPESWDPIPRKLLTPREFVLSTVRALDLKLPIEQVMRALNVMGQPLYAPPSPKGFPDEAGPWLAPDLIKARLDWVNTISRRFSRADVIQLAHDLWGDTLSDETRTAIRRAESRQQALTLLLMSPDHMRR